VISARGRGSKRNSCGEVRTALPLGRVCTLTISPVDCGRYVVLMVLVSSLVVGDWRYLALWLTTKGTVSLDEE